MNNSEFRAIAIAVIANFSTYLKQPIVLIKNKPAIKFCNCVFSKKKIKERIKYVIYNKDAHRDYAPLER